MRTQAVVLVLCAALAGAGCGTTPANLREWGSAYAYTETTGVGAFVADEWLEASANVEGRRPVRRRGGGEPGRRQPPLLNPRPTAEQRQAQERRAADLALVLQARQLYSQRLKEAQEKYPNSEGYENHHFVPRYLGGPENGRTFRIPTAYHKAITQAFRARWKYGGRKPNPEELQGILVDIYSKYPIPQLVGIEP